MIKDVTGIFLTPGNEGKDCLGNGNHFDENGVSIECCCDECNYAECCLPNDFYDYHDEKIKALFVPYPERCRNCNDYECPRNQS